MGAKLKRDGLSVFIGLLSVEFYWPLVLWGPKGKWENAEKVYFIGFPTVITYRPAHNWAWDTAAAIKVLGFGIGFAWKHCDNPNTKESK